MSDLSEQEMYDIRERLKSTRLHNQLALEAGLTPQMRLTANNVDAFAEFKRHLPEMIESASEADKTQEDCMAGKIAARMMRELGFREPLKHPKWQEIADVVQDEIDANMDTMIRVAKLNAEAK